MRKEFHALRHTPPPDEALELEDDIAEMLGLDLPTEEPVTPEASSCEAPISTVAVAAGEGTGSRPATGGPGLPDPAAGEQKMNGRSGNVDENKGRCPEKSVQELSSSAGERPYVAHDDSLGNGLAIGSGAR